MDKVSIVVTVLNEEGTVKELLDSLVNQSRKANEIIIVDGGSNDKTVEIIKKYKKIKLIQGKYGRSEGRNIGVLAAKGEIIAFTDAGCVPEKDWLEKLTRDMGEGVVSGYYKGSPSNIFEKCLVPYVLVMPDKIGDEFLPSTRSMAIKKDLFIKAGGLNEGLDTSEDFEFAHRLKAMEKKFVFAKDAVVGWYPRKNLKQAAWMFFKFAATDIHAGILRKKVKLLAIRYYVFTFLVFLYWPSAVLLLGYLVWAIIKNYKHVKDIRAFFWLPVLQLTADICVLLGTIAGLLSRGSLGQ